MPSEDGFVDKVIHDTVVRSVGRQYRDEVAQHRARTEVLGRIMAIHGLASSLVTLPGRGTYMCLDIERLSQAQLDGIESIITAIPPPMPEEIIEDIAFDGMEGERGELSEDD